MHVVRSTGYTKLNVNITVVDKMTIGITLSTIIFIDCNCFSYFFKQNTKG